MENGLMGVEKYPFFGMKYENDNPNCCACTKEHGMSNAMKSLLIFRIIFLNCSQSIIFERMLSNS
ncbi:hypothetical protein D3C83_119770 [compost metagenome]